VSDDLVTSDVALSEEVREFLDRTTTLYGSSDIDAAVEGIFTHDAVYADHRPLLRGTVTGWPPLKAHLRTTLEMLPDFRIRVHVLAQAGNCYLARDTYVGHASMGGGQAEMQWWVVDELRDGLLAREDIYETEAEARAEYERRAG
jgi:hypothetical protein